MRHSTLPLRLLALLLVILWVLFATLVLQGTGAEGQHGPLAVAALVLPAFVAASVAVWPARRRFKPDRRVRLSSLWCGLLAVLVLVPLLALLARPPAGAFAEDGLVEEAPRAVTLSAEPLYATLVAVLFTAFFTGLAVAWLASDGGGNRRPARLGIAAGVALACSAALSLALGLPRPTGPLPPACTTAPTPAVSSEIRLTAERSLAGEPDRAVALTGARAGADRRWEAELMEEGASAFFGYVRIGDEAWVRRDDDWSAVQTGLALETAPGIAYQAASRSREGGSVVASSEAGPAAAWRLDRAVDDVLTAQALAVAEDRGLVEVEDEVLRHCRTVVDGPTAFRAFAPLHWLVPARAPTDLPGGAEVQPRKDLPDATPTAPQRFDVQEEATPDASAPPLRQWRGELSWWLDLEGQLAMASVDISGLPPAEWDSVLQGTLEARMRIVPGDGPDGIEAPLP